jgi:hypothetical protein
MPVELERGVPLVATTVADLRALAIWPPDVRLIRPSDPRLPESVVSSERERRVYVIAGTKAGDGNKAKGPIEPS